MENKQSYSVSDLAAALEVPRTTLNDWLIKYARFLDTEIKGKRKVYTTRAFEVLQDVAKFRNDGVQLVDIDALLEKKYGIHGEVQDKKVTENCDENNENDGNSSSNELTVANKNVEEMTVLVKNQFEELLLRIEQVNKERNKAIRRTNLYFSLFLIMAFILIGAGGLLGLKLIKKIQEENSMNAATISAQYHEITENITAKIEESDRKITALSGKTEEDLENLVSNLSLQNESLKKELLTQKEEYKNLLTSLMEENKALEAQTLADRNEFAKKQLELLQILEKNQAELEKIISELEAGRAENAELKEKLQRIEEIQTQTTKILSTPDPETKTPTNTESTSQIEVK